MSRRQILVELQRLVVIRDGAIEIVLRPIGLAPAIESRRGLRLCCDCGVVIGKSAVELALCIVDRCPLRKGERRLRIDIAAPCRDRQGHDRNRLWSDRRRPIDVGRNLIALGFQTPTGDKFRATDDPRIEVGAATSHPPIALGKSRRTERNATERSKHETNKEGK